MYGISPTYRRNLKTNLALAGYTNARTRRAAIAHAGRMLTETPAIWLRPQHEVAALVREASGVKEALEQRTRGKEMLLITQHIGCLGVEETYVSKYVTNTMHYCTAEARLLVRL